MKILIAHIVQVKISSISTEADMVNNDLGTTRKIVRISRKGQILITTGMRTGKATNCCSEEGRKEGGAEQGNLLKIRFL